MLFGPCLSSKTPLVVHSKPRDQWDSRMAPTIPIAGSIHINPKYFVVSNATIARDEGWHYAFFFLSPTGIRLTDRSA